MKGIGIIFVFMSCCGTGIYLSMRMKHRYERLLTFRKLIDDTAVFIRYGALTVREIMERLSENPCYSGLIFLKKDFSDRSRPAFAVWLDGVEEDCTLSREEKKLLSELGRKLGTTDTEGQLSYIGTLSRELDAMIKKQGEEYAVKGKLCRSMGILVGAMAGIMLV